jgi:hypothetical protein
MTTGLKSVLTAYAKMDRHPEFVSRQRIITKRIVILNLFQDNGQRRVLC